MIMKCIYTTTDCKKIDMYRLEIIEIKYWICLEFNGSSNCKKADHWCLFLHWSTSFNPFFHENCTDKSGAVTSTAVAQIGNALEKRFPHTAWETVC